MPSSCDPVHLLDAAANNFQRKGLSFEEHLLLLNLGCSAPSQPSAPKSQVAVGATPPSPCQPAVALPVEAAAQAADAQACAVLGPHEETCAMRTSKQLCLVARGRDHT